MEGRNEGLNPGAASARRNGLLLRLGGIRFGAARRGNPSRRRGDRRSRIAWSG